MKKLLFAGIAVSMLAACSNDEVVPVNNESNAIKFSAIAENGTRAADIYCPNYVFEKFDVVAAFGTNPYISGDEIIKDGDSWKNNSGLRYWPESGTLNFFAHVNAGEKFQWTAGNAPKFDNFVVDGTVANQKDLMYATKTKGKTSDNVTLNFRHALSQVVFQAKNTNKNLYVEVEGVSVVNVNNTGTYTFPINDTDKQINHPEGINADDSEVRGSWNKTQSGNTKYDVTFTAVPVTGNGNVMPLTTFANDLHASGANAATYKNAVKNAMILLPQTTTATDLKNVTGKNLKEANTGVGSYFLVKCKMWNVAGTAFNEKTDVVVWPRKKDIEAKADPDGLVEAAYALIPVRFEWEQGKKYTYTFTFGNGSGGVDPENPTDPVLVPITFSVTVDEFIAIDKGEYDINGNTLVAE